MSKKDVHIEQRNDLTVQKSKKQTVNGEKITVKRKKDKSIIISTNSGCKGEDPLWNHKVKVMSLCTSALQKLQADDFPGGVADATEAIGICNTPPFRTWLLLMYCVRGVAFQKQGDHSAAIADLERCNAIDSSFAREIWKDELIKLKREMIAGYIESLNGDGFSFPEEDSDSANNN